MSEIKILDSDLISKIAAGEVIERPSSVVKELIENSIDANAKNITIKIKGAGKELIEVIDDGKGMSKKDLQIAFSSHATSKIRTTNDLFNITSMGFRGEALPSIASISEVNVISSRDNLAYEAIFREKKLIKIERTSFNKGTKISVYNLFYNTPARLKYLKTDYTEIAKIDEVITKASLSRPDIAFSLYVEDKLTIKTSGRNDLKEIILNLFGLEIAKNLIEIENKDSDFKISGLVSNMNISKSNRNFIHTFINHRPVRVISINSRLVEIYQKYLINNRYPIAFINVEVDPYLVDVNVHPSKHEVRLSKEKQLLFLLEEAIEKVFNKKEPSKKIDINKEITKQESLLFSEENNQINLYDYKEENLPINDLIKEENSLYYMDRLIGQFGGSYIIFERNEDLILLDQHAAMERINFEKFTKIYSDVISWHFQELLIPLVLNYSPQESKELLNYIDLLNEIGIRISEFGTNTFKIDLIPTWLKEDEIIFFVEELINKLINSTSKFKIEELRQEAIATLSCKASLKFNRYLTNKEQEEIIRNLFKCENPLNCPHGRPTMISFSMIDLDKFFKRR